MTFFPPPPPGNNTCFYGKCYYCRESEPACAEAEVMEGSLTLWLPDVWPLQKHRHPWGRTYREGKLARWAWLIHTWHKPPEVRSPIMIHINRCRSHIYIMIFSFSQLILTENTHFIHSFQSMVKSFIKTTLYLSVCLPQVGVR